MVVEGFHWVRWSGVIIHYTDNYLLNQWTFLLIISVIINLFDNYHNFN